MDHFLSITNSRNIFTHFETFLPNESVGKSNLSVLVGLDPGRGQLFTNNDKKNQILHSSNTERTLSSFWFLLSYLFVAPTSQDKSLPKTEKTVYQKRPSQPKTGRPGSSTLCQKNERTTLGNIFHRGRLDAKNRPKSLLRVSDLRGPRQRKIFLLLSTS